MFYLGPLSTPTCPYCRQRMTVLLPFFSDIETNAADLDVATVERRQKLYDNIRSYNRLFSGIKLIKLLNIILILNYVQPAFLYL